MISSEGYITIAIFALITCLVFSFSWGFGLICLFTTVLVVYFFRDPQRVILLDEKAILSPADGMVYDIKNIIPPKIFNITEPLTRISIFLSALNVHVNRIPVSGVVNQLNYTPGSFVRADSFASEDNEKQEILITMADGTQIVVVQQAGLLARRIVCNLKEGMKVEAGKRFGIIKFGSRVDIYLPSGITPLVAKKQTLVAGETVIAKLDNAELEYKFKLD